MNFRKVFVAAFSIATLYSCTTSPTADLLPAASGVEITATISESEVRTSLGSESSGVRKVLWEADDKVALYDDTAYLRELSLTAGSGSNSATFSGLAVADFTSKIYYALYPASAAKARTSTGVDVVLPAVHTSIDGSDTPMVGLTSNTGAVSFATICGLLELRITGVMTNLESITLTSKSKPLSGVAHVSVSSGKPTVTVEGEKSISLTPANAIALTSTAKSFFVALPAANYPAGDLTITINAEEGKFEFESSKAHDLKLSHIKPITGINVEVEPEYINLTANEAYANCFVVPEKGWYSFDARTRAGLMTVSHPKTGAVVTSIGGNGAKACVAWESSANMISEIEYDMRNNRVVFYYNGTKGNAMICMVGGDGQVQWNWHIWATDTPKEQKIGSNTYLDRNVGAWVVPTNAADGWNYMHRQWNNAKAVYPTAGLLYQWGRPVAFPQGGYAHLRNSGTSQREDYTVVFANLGCESSASSSSDPHYGDTPTYSFPSSSILGSVYTDKSAVAVSGTWSNRWWYANNTTQISLLTALQNPMKVYGTAAANEPIALKDIKVQNYYVEDCAPKKFWCNDLFNGSFDFGSAHSPWNYGAQESKAFDVCPYGYHIADAGKAIADFATLGLKWRYQNSGGTAQAEGFIPSGQTTSTGAAYATASDGSFVWIPTSGARAFYGAYTDMCTINWWGSSNNNKVANIQFGADASQSASVVVKDGYLDVGAGTYTYEGKSYPIADQNRIDETSISMALAVRCVKDTAADEDPSKLPVDDMEQVIDGNEW